MIKNAFLELIIALAIVLGTLAAIMLIRLFVKRAECAISKPPMEITLYYDSECECFEMLVSRLINSGAVRQFDLKLTVVDLEKTCESAKWLYRLQKKLDYRFDIVSG